jgi:hypothetical protein
MEPGQLLDGLARMGMDRRRRIAMCVRAMGEALSDCKFLNATLQEAALPLAELQETGAMPRDLRLLHAAGVVGACQQSDAAGDAVRPVAYFLDPDSARLLLAWSDQVIAQEFRLAPDEGSGSGPKWDGERREFSVGGLLVKRYRVRAESQTLILTAFEESGWPARVDDPLPGIGRKSQGERLHEAVRGLNRGHLRRLIRFFRDGLSEGVGWSLIGSESTAVSPGSPPDPTSHARR